MPVSNDSAGLGDDPTAALERALELYLRHVASNARDDARLLRDNAALRQLLEPMLHGSRVELEEGPMLGGCGPGGEEVTDPGGNSPAAQGG